MAQEKKVYGTPDSVSEKFIRMNRKIEKQLLWE